MTNLKSKKKNFHVSARDEADIKRRRRKLIG